jgi:hypothetical protein
MANKKPARQNEERKADELIVKVKKQKIEKAKREDVSQTAARIVREATKE